MRLDPAFAKAQRELAALPPYVVAAKSGVDFSGGRFTIPFLGRTILITHPGLEAREAGAEAPPPEWLQLMLLHYLLTADGAPVEDRWISYRELEGVYLFEGKFTEHVPARLAQAFGRDLGAFRRAGLALGGTPLSRTGDAAFRFLALPRLPVAVILYGADEEMEATANFLFDGSATHYLPIEDLIILGAQVAAALVQAAGAGG